MKLTRNCFFFAECNFALSLESLPNAVRLYFDSIIFCVSVCLFVTRYRPRAADGRV